MKKKLNLYVFAVLCWPLSGCVSVGETAIRTNRTSYNEAIHDTSNQQLLLNIVRAKNLDAPTFLTATEIDGTNTASASVSGTSSMIGLLGGAVGSITGVATLSDSPISKYQSLTGAELISQVSLPIPPQAISKLETSDWPITPLIELTIERFTPQFLDYYKALTVIDYLDRYGAISFASKGTADLSIVFHRSGNVRPGAIQADDRSDQSTLCPTLGGVGDSELQALWKKFQHLMSDDRLRATPISPNSLLLGSVTDDKSKANESGAPLYTYSAYGSLRLAEHDVPVYVAHSVEEARAIRAFNFPYVDLQGQEVRFCSNGD